MLHLNYKGACSLLALSGNEIVEASLLRPMGEEHRTSSTPGEEATLLDKI